MYKKLNKENAGYNYMQCLCSEAFIKTEFMMQFALD